MEINTPGSRTDQEIVEVMKLWVNHLSKGVSLRNLKAPHIAYISLRNPRQTSGFLICQIKSRSDAIKVLTSDSRARTRKRWQVSNSPGDGVSNPLGEGQVASEQVSPADSHYQYYC